MYAKRVAVSAISESVQYTAHTNSGNMGLPGPIAGGGFGRDWWLDFGSSCINLCNSNLF